MRPLPRLFPGRPPQGTGRLNPPEHTSRRSDAARGPAGRGRAGGRQRRREDDRRWLCADFASWRAGTSGVRAAAGRDAMVIFASLSQILSADIFIAFLSVSAAEPAALIAQKFHLVLLGICQGVQFVKGLVQAKIRNNIAKILLVLRPSGGAGFRRSV